MIRPIRIAQIGIGHNHASATMETIRKFPEVFEVMGVAEDDAAWRAKRQSLKAYEGLTFMSEEELLRLPGLEAVCVEKDVPALIPTAIRCAKKGLHVRLDKPGGESFAAFAHLVEILKEKDRVFQVAYMYRYNPYIRKCMEMVKSGALGEVFQIDAQMSSTHPKAYRDWLGQFTGGDMYIFGSHLIDLIVYMLGEPQHVYALNKNSFPETASCVDNALAVLDYPRASCVVRCNSMEANGYYRRQLVVCGSKGTVEIKPLENPTQMSVAWAEPFIGDELHTNGHPDSRKQVHCPLEGGRYDAQLLDFARVIRGESPNVFDYAHELSVQRTVLRACTIEAM